MNVVALVSSGGLASARAVPALEQMSATAGLEAQCAALRSLVAMAGDAKHMKRLKGLVADSFGQMNGALIAFRLAQSESPEAIQGPLDGLDSAPLPNRPLT